MKRRVLTVIAVITGLLITTALVTASIWPTLNDVTTGATPEYPDVLPQYFSADPKRVYAEATAAVESLQGWNLVEERREETSFDATRETTLGFVDDVTITVAAETEFVTRVDVRSRSRVGRGDFGQNARNIREFQSELDDRLGAVRFDPFKERESTENP